MQYLGGKSKTRKQISTFLESVRNGKEYFEPFVGGAWVLIAKSDKGYQKRKRTQWRGCFGKVKYF